MFPDGGPLTDEEYYDLMEKVAEKNYRNWGFRTPYEGYIHALNDNTYNYRGFYNDNPDAVNDAESHWPDTYKTVYHPTFSNESKYSGIVDKNYNPKGITGGFWLDEYRFVPSLVQMANREYWNRQYGDGGNLFVDGGDVNPDGDNPIYTHTE